MALFPLLPPVQKLFKPFPAIGSVSSVTSCSKLFALLRFLRSLLFKSFFAVSSVPAVISCSILSFPLPCFRIILPVFLRSLCYLLFKAFLPSSSVPSVPSVKLAFSSLHPLFRLQLCSLCSLPFKSFSSRFGQLALFPLLPPVQSLFPCPFPPVKPLLSPIYNPLIFNHLSFIPPPLAFSPSSFSLSLGWVQPLPFPAAFFVLYFPVPGRFNAARNSWMYQIWTLKKCSKNCSKKC